MRQKFALIIFLFLQISTLKGQPFTSIFGIDTTRWNIYECAPDAGGTFQYYSFNDTIIDTDTYNRIYRKNINNVGGYSHTYVCGYIKEDTTSGKYWFLKFDDTDKQKVLFMDLSLSQGDTIGIVSDFRFMWVDSVKVDSVYFENDRKIIELLKFHTDCSNEMKIRYIEGIGPSNGFYMGEDFENPESYSLLCKYETEQLVYSTISNSQGNCILEPGGSIHDYKLQIDFEVYPIPSKSEIYIVIKNFIKEKYQYYIYNTLGQLVFTEKIKKPITSVIINTSGIYSLMITDKKRIITKKIIINGN